MLEEFWLAIIEIVLYPLADPFDNLFDAYIFAIECCVPGGVSSPRARKALKIAVISFTLILVLVLVWGIFLWRDEDMYFKTLGKWMVIASVGLHILQIAFGITMHCLSKKKNR